MTDIRYKVGSTLYAGRDKVVVQAALSFYDVLVRRVHDGAMLTFKTSDLSSRPADEAPPNYTGLEGVSPEKEAIARRRLEALRPIIDSPRPAREMYRDAAAKLEISRATVYRLLRRYAESPRLSALLPTASDGGRGRPRIAEASLAIATSTIREHYLKRRNRSVTDSYGEYEARCKRADVSPCHYSTFRRMVLALDEQEVMALREGKRKARTKFSAATKHFPCADRPLSVVQMDHTVLDVFVVDDVDRIAIARPWLTIAIDVYSRMVTGFYLSLDPVGTLSAGLCLYRSMIAKEDWLAELGVPGEWPIRGKPTVLHFDNAKEFRGKVIRLACDELTILHQFRPVKRPAYGGTVERLMGTISKEMRILPGASPLDVRRMEDFDPRKHAVFTLKELEAYLADFICNKYHLRHHDGIGGSPLEKAKEGFLGAQGIGIPSDIENKRMLKLLLMPMQERTIQRYGIKMEHVHYWSPALHRFFTPDARKREKFKVRFDPRDISEVHVWIDQLGDYLSVGYGDPTRPRMSLWDLRAAVSAAPRHDGEIHEQDVFETYERLRRREEEAVTKTKSASKARKARTNIQRRRSHQQASAANKPASPPQASPAAPAEPSLPDDDVVMPFPDRRTR